MTNAHRHPEPTEIASTVRLVIQRELERIDVELQRLQAQRAAMYALLENQALETIAGSITQSLTGITVACDPSSLQDRLTQLFELRPRLRIGEAVSMLVEQWRLPITQAQVEAALRSCPDRFKQNTRGWWSLQVESAYGPPRPDYRFRVAGGVPA